MIGFRYQKEPLGQPGSERVEGLVIGGEDQGAREAKRGKEVQVSRGQCPNSGNTDEARENGTNSKAI